MSKVNRLYWISLLYVMLMGLVGQWFTWHKLPYWLYNHEDPSEIAVIIIVPYVISMVMAVVLAVATAIIKVVVTFDGGV